MINVIFNTRSHLDQVMVRVACVMAISSNRLASKEGGVSLETIWYGRPGHNALAWWNKGQSSTMTIVRLYI
jgi:hypothetical protein